MSNDEYTNKEIYLDIFCLLIPNKDNIILIYDSNNTMQYNFLNFLLVA